MDAGKRKILVVDDEEDILSALKETLVKDYTVFSASNGRDAVEISQKVIPDLIVMDILMPEMDGLEACRLIKKERMTSAVPVLMLTAKNQIEFSAKGFESGANSYMVKPFSPLKLLEKIKELIQKADIRKGIS